MIHHVLKVLQQELEMFLTRKYNIQDECTVLGPILDELGNINKENKNKVVLSITNFIQEKNSQYATKMSSTAAYINARDKLLSYHVDLLITASYDNYLASLDFLSTAHNFFQEKAVFTPQNSPGLPLHIQKVSLEAMVLNYQEMESLWSMLGARYMPSVLYKIVIVGREESAIATEISASASANISS